MLCKHMVVAIDHSEAGRSATRFAGRLAMRAGAEITVLSVLPVSPNGGETSRDALDGLQAMLGKKIFASHPSLPVELAVARGVPQVEIPRFAERVKADLIVLGRKSRSRTTRLILGDTADAVVRRSRLPALLVPAGLSHLGRILVALDGTDRGLGVLRTSLALAQSADLDFRAVTVEPVWPGEPPMVSSRSERLAHTVEDCLQQESKSAGKPLATGTPLHIRHGDIVAEIVSEAVDVHADILVTGFHPGGPLLVVEEGSVSRKLLHAASCAVLTVPL